jgi:hypothetical protein
MGGKSKTKKVPAKLAATANLPAPQIVPKDKVGETVQDFIDFGGAKTVQAEQQDAQNWLVTVTS